MPVFRFAGFNGEVRAIEPKLLPDNICTVSRNHKPGRGDLRPWKQPLQVATVPAGSKTIYRMGRDVNTDSQYWLSWPSVVKAVRGFSADDTTEQTFYTGDGIPKWTNNVFGLASAPYPTTGRPMGLPAPTSALNASVQGSGTTTPTTETYVYVYTYVNDQGWESAPSPPSNEATRDVLGSTTLTGFAAPPSGGYFISTIRIYKSQTTSGGADFFYLAEVPLGTTSVTDENQPVQETLRSTTWLPAPGIPIGGSANITEPTLTGLTAMWNGMMAGISGNAVRVCEPYVPYAWPVAYDVIPPDSKPVALGVFGQNLVVLTTGRPLVVNGSTPDGLDQALLEMPQACVSAPSAVSMGYGVVWSSEDGLCMYGSGGPRVVTSGLMLREDWQALKPHTIIGQRYEGLYFGSYDDGSGRKGFFIDPANPTGMYFVDAGFEAMHFDELKDQLYVLSGASVGRWDAGASMTVRARSKVYKQPYPTNYGAAEVVATSYPVTFRLFADGVLKHTQVVQGRDPFKLPSGFRAFDYQVELEGVYPVQGVAVASATAELSQV